MAIPESQFETWAKQGATASASAIYGRVDRVLENHEALAQRDFEIFLQGSYRNSTNIRGDSDVDVIVKLNQTYMPDYSQLDESTRRWVVSRAESATYSFYDFRKDVSAAIRAGLSTHAIEEGGKSIKIPRTSNNIPADVVPCLTYRQYLPGYGLNSELMFIEGIWLYDLMRGIAVVSFPKQHYDNGVSKQQATDNRYKRTVRIFKNLRGRMEDKKLIAAGSASSHSVECLLYNVPNACFDASHTETYVSVVNWLSRADISGFLCQNGVQPLFAAGRWNTRDARSFIDGLIETWNRWS